MRSVSVLLIAIITTTISLSLIGGGSGGQGVASFSPLGGSSGRHGDDNTM